MTLRDLWLSINIVPKILMVTSPVWLLVMCNLMPSATPLPDDMNPEQLAAATDMAAVAFGDAAFGQATYFDDLSANAPKDCGGRFIWAFNVDGAGSISLRDYSGAAVTSGRYTLISRKLLLTGLVERHFGTQAGVPDKRTKDVSYTISRAENGRLIIGSKNYRQCTFAAPKADVPAQRSPVEIQEPFSPSTQEPVQLAPVRSSEPLTASRACQRLEIPLGELLESNSQGALKVIEVSAIDTYSSFKVDGNPSCYGSIITNLGTLYGFFWMSRTPKGQLLMQWRIDEAATEIFN